jgi:hypothetical protein
MDMPRMGRRRRSQQQREHCRDDNRQDRDVHVVLQADHSSRSARTINGIEVVIIDRNQSPSTRQNEVDITRT